MTHDLEGADLSRAVARLVGGKNGNVDHATNPERIPELLAWLYANHPWKGTAKSIYIEMCEGELVGDAPRFYASCNRVTRRGATLQEAACRLVLALAEAREPKERP